MFLFLACVMISLMEQSMIFCLVPLLGISLMCKDLEQFCKYAQFFSGKESVCILIILPAIYLFISTEGLTPLFQIREKNGRCWETQKGFNIHNCLMFLLIAWYFCALLLANNLNIFIHGREGNRR